MTWPQILRHISSADETKIPPLTPETLAASALIYSPVPLIPGSRGILAAILPKISFLFAGDNGGGVGDTSVQAVRQRFAFEFAQ